MSEQLTTAVEDDFVPVRSLDELKVQEPGTRIKVSIRRGFELLAKREIVCFTGKYGGSETCPEVFYTFLDNPARKFLINSDRETLLGFSCDDRQMYFDEQGIIRVGRIPGITIPRISCNPELGDVYQRDLELLKKARLLPEGVTA